MISLSLILFLIFSTTVFAEVIEADCVYSLGERCRTASQLKKNGLRLDASPLDWMRDYNLKTALHFFETKFDDFFDKYEVIDRVCHSGNIHIVDTAYSIVSTHYMDPKKPFEEEYKEFRKMMKSRGEKMHGIFLKSSDIVFVSSCRENTSKEDFIEFLKGFSKLYPGKKVTIINLIREKVEEITQKTIYNEEGLKLIEFKCDDAYWTEQWQWEGNPEIWKEVLKHIKLRTLK